MSNNQTKSMSVTDTEIGRVVVERYLATSDEVAECLIEQERLSADNRRRSLTDILVDKGVVTTRQLERVIESLEEIRPAQQIPGYQILSKLGSGAMATVFKARQLSLDRLVAIKVLPRRFSENPEYVERFYKEGKAAAKLNHANIVQAFDVGEAGGYHYFVMEYVEGHTVYDELAGGKVFSEAEALKIAIEIAEALAHSHERGLIHRDVKPKNIMITTEGVAKLADMGLARLAEDTQAAQAEAGKAYGTPYYISPEQIRGEMDIDFRADIYGLGATLYHMVTGQVPFEADTPVAVMNKHLKEPLLPPDHVNTSLSVGLGEVVEVMMAKQREDRYASTIDLLIDLKSVARGEPPLQVHRILDAHSLSALAQEEQPVLETSSPISDTQIVLIYILLALLAISLIANIILALV
ncbi:MAG: serine/threonine-protein kinase [Planctomycetota bacterium]|nr:serine/threonine-protein kinase [Planctomycetota bacterium]